MAAPPSIQGGPSIEPPLAGLIERGCVQHGCFVAEAAQLLGQPITLPVNSASSFADDRASDHPRAFELIVTTSSSRRNAPNSDVRPLSLASDSLIPQPSTAGEARVRHNVLLRSFRDVFHFLLGGEAAKAVPDRGVRQLVADVADREMIARVLERCAPVCGVFHAAGVLDDAPVEQLDDERIAATLAAKARGTEHLDALVREAPLVVFSSAAAQFGGPGQAAYAAANAAANAAYAATNAAYAANAANAADVPLIDVAHQVIDRFIELTGQPDWQPTLPTEQAIERMLDVKQEVSR